MRILCVSDEVDPLVYSARIRDRFGDVDMVLAAGDLPLEYLEFVASMLNRPLLYVEGNHDLGSLGTTATWGYGYDFKRSFGARNMNFRFAREAGLSILGLPGSMAYNRGPNQYSEFSMGLRILLLAPRLLLERILRGRAVDIVLTHAPPRGIHDRDDRCHWGFVVYRHLMRLAKPRWFIHGHVHLYDLTETRSTLEGETTVVNAFGHWIIDTGPTP
jgi:hypothetical protein